MSEAGLSQESVPYPTRVRGQIWESLVSMLRVYAHAASLNGKQYVVTEGLGKAWVKNDEVEDCILELSFRPETGEAVWRITRAEVETWGEFRIDEDGTLEFPAGAKALDTAAIEWIEQLDRAAATMEQPDDTDRMGVTPLKPSPAMNEAPVDATDLKVNA